MSLPSPATNQAFCRVSALDGGSTQSPLSFILDPSPGGSTTNPSLSFLIQHSVRPETFLLDLGLHKDWEAHSPGLSEQIAQLFGVTMQAPAQDVASALRAGGLDPAAITHVCISTVFIDHMGDPAPFTGATFVVGAGARALPDPSTGHTQPFSSRVFADLPQNRVRFLELEKTPPLGPFAHALDFYGDGSLYIVDAPGHLPGHINVLARTSPDGGWIYLAGDSAHDWRLIRGEAKMSKTPMCLHMEPDKAEQHMQRIAKLQEANKRVRVILTHDQPWYQQNKGGKAFWPGQIASL